MQGEELLCPQDFTHVCVSVEGDLHSWAGGAGRGFADERVHQSVYLRVIPTASAKMSPSGLPAFLMTS